MKEKNLRKKLLGIPLILSLSLTVFAICGTILLFQTLKQNTIETNENYLSHYMTEIKKSLDSYRLMVANNELEDEFLNSFVSGGEENKILYAKRSLAQQWTHLLELYPEIDGIYLIGEEENFFFINPQSSYTLQSPARKEIKNWVKQLNENQNPFQDGWQVFKTEESYFLNCSILQKNSLFGIWIRGDKFLDFFQEYREKGENEILFQLKNEESKNHQFEDDYLIITQYFEGEDFGLTLLIEKEKMLASVRHILWIFLFLGIIALIITICYILMLYKAILRIEDLNRKVYEEKIWGLKLKGQLLQIQIKPHFFLNSLSNILSFLYVGEIEPAEKMIVYLANHIRYLLNSGSLICLGDEIAHIKNYLAMQSLRFGPNFSCKISISPELEECLIPILSVQTFVENSIKHAKSEDGKVCIFLSAFSVKVEDSSYIKILIEDDAGGFDPQILEKLNHHEPLEHEKRSHIGISNVRERIEWLYNGRGKLYLSNGKFHGALIEILLPLIYEKDQLKEKIGEST